MTACVLPYHGGKTRIAPKVAAVLDHSACEHYCEPFAGGLAVLFQCRNRRVETINDKTDAVIAFWDTMAHCPEKFYALAQARGIHSESLYLHSREIVKGNLVPESRVELAWALWYCSTTSFGKRLGSGYGYAVGAGYSGGATSLDSRIDHLIKHVERIKRFQIFNRCALDLIATMCHEDVVLYCDPPYVDTTTSAAYSDFTTDELRRLCDLLRAHKGDWAISGYDHPVLMQLADEYRVVEIETIGTLSKAEDTDSTRRAVYEQLVTNIEERTQQLAL